MVGRKIDTALEVLDKLCFDVYSLSNYNVYTNV